jgi:hypothetical protein
VIRKNETALQFGTIRVSGRLLRQGNFLGKTYEALESEISVFLESFSGNQPRLGR